MKLPTNAEEKECCQVKLELDSPLVKPYLEYLYMMAYNHQVFGSYGMGSSCVGYFGAHQHHD
jgi:hypothetical protein